MADITIIGAGLAGLACGRILADSGVDFEILEATDRVGGRVRTDLVDGFTLDHGFQVLLTAYPACQTLLDYEQLRLRTFDPGAMIRAQGQFHILGDPWRKPTQALRTALAPVGSLTDKLRIAKLRSLSRSGSLEDLYQRPQSESAARLKELGFSDKMIQLFFQPFFGGVFLEDQLTTSSRMMEFVFRMFASGPVAIPADGMASIARQLADRLPRGSLKLSHSVEKVDGISIQLSSGQSLVTKQVVIATESTAIAAMFSSAKATDGNNGSSFSTDEFQKRSWQKTVCMYFTADQAPHHHKLLMLRGDETSSPINNVAVLTNVAKEYAPPGKCLISVSLAQNQVNDFSSGNHDQLLQQVSQQLEAWFGSQASNWKHLRTYNIPYSLPSQSVKDFQTVVRSVEPWGSAGPICCGDHRETSSIQGALNSGMRAAKAVLQRIRN